MKPLSSSERSVDLHGFISKKTGSHISFAVATPKFLVNSVFAGRQLHWMLTV
jgi:hypothetical protein